MAKGMHKKKSKRIPAKRRYNIEKKVREHNKKKRKEMKKKGKPIVRPKQIRVPNSAPFKEAVLKEAREHMEAKKLAAREKKQTKKKSAARAVKGV